MPGYVPAATALDPLGLALGQGLGNGIANIIQQQQMKSDFTDMLQYLGKLKQAQEASTPQMQSQYIDFTTGEVSGSGFGSPAATVEPLPPRLKTPEMQRMLLQLQLGRMLDPVQQAEIAYKTAAAENERAQAWARRNPSQTLSASDTFREVIKNPDGQYHRWVFSPTGQPLRDLGIASPKDIGDLAGKTVERRIAGKEDTSGLPENTVYEVDTTTNKTNIIFKPDQLTPDQMKTQRQLEYMKILEAEEQTGSITPERMEDLRKLRTGAGISVTTNIGTDKPMPQPAIESMLSDADTLKTIDELQSMMQPQRVDPVSGKIVPAGPGTEMVGLWDAAVSAIKEKTGQLTPDQVIFNQRYTRLQKLIRTLNGEARLSDQDAKRLANVVPSKIIKDPAFRAALEDYQKEIPERLNRNRQIYEAQGYKVPTPDMLGIQNQGGGNAAGTTRQFQIGESRPIKGKTWYYKGNNKWTDNPNDPALIKK